MGYIQGNNAVLMLFKSDYEPFVCATEFSLEIAAEPLPIRTVGDGHYNKNTYNTVGFTLTMSGLLAFDDNAFAGWDMIDKQLGFVDCLFRLSYEDDEGNAKSFQGACVIQTSTLASRVDEFTTNEFSLLGNGKLDFFDGLLPCDSAITDILFTDLGNDDNQIAIAYNYTGSPVRINWYLDEYSDVPRSGFVNVGETIFIHDINTGSHNIRLEPLCASGFVGIDMTADFVVTAGEACDIAITSATHEITGQSIKWTFVTTGGTPPDNYVKMFMNDTLVYNGSYAADITLNAIPYGTNEWRYEFYCNNNLLGDQLTENINVPGGAKLTILYKTEVLPASGPIAMTVLKNGATLVFWASPNSQTFDILVTDVISVSVTNTDSRRLIVRKDFANLYNNTGTSLSYTIPAIVSDSVYSITLQLP